MPTFFLRLQPPCWRRPILSPRTCFAAWLKSPPTIPNINPYHFPQATPIVAALEEWRPGFLESGPPNMYGKKHRDFSLAKEIETRSRGACGRPPAAAYSPAFLRTLFFVSSGKRRSKVKQRGMKRDLVLLAVFRMISSRKIRMLTGASTPSFTLSLSTDKIGDPDISSDDNASFSFSSAPACPRASFIA